MTTEETESVLESNIECVANVYYDEIRERRYHMVILRSHLTQPWRDAYLMEVARALTHLGHRVTYCIVNSADDAAKLKPCGPVTVCYLKTWIPKSIFGTLKSLMDICRLSWSALKLVVLPPKPTPKIIFCDTNPVVIPILRILGRYSTVVFPTTIICSETLCLKPFQPSWFHNRMVRWSNEIYVENKCFLEIFDKCYDVCKTAKILCPSVDNNLLISPCLPLNDLIPDIPENALVFVSFGLYEKRTNFKLGLNAFEILYKKLEQDKSPLLSRVYYVIAGECKVQRHSTFFEEILSETKLKDFASQVTFFRNVSLKCKHSLLKHCLAVVHTKQYDIFSAIILEAMCFGCALIAPNSGFAREAMINKMSGFLLEPQPSKFAVGMAKLINSKVLASSMGVLAKDTYVSEFSFQFFMKNIEMLILELIIDYKSIKKK